MNNPCHMKHIKAYKYQSDYLVNDGRKQSLLCHNRPNNCQYQTHHYDGDPTKPINFQPIRHSIIIKEDFGFLHFFSGGIVSQFYTIVHAIIFCCCWKLAVKQIQTSDCKRSHRYENDKEYQPNQLIRRKRNLNAHTLFFIIYHKLLFGKLFPSVIFFTFSEKVLNSIIFLHKTQKNNKRIKGKKVKQKQLPKSIKCQRRYNKSQQKDMKNIVYIYIVAHL